MKRNTITIITLITSLVLIGIGIAMSQYRDVLVKAINICLECIGIG